MPDQDKVSLPFYGAALVITLCGTLAANAALTVPDTNWLLQTTTLTILGFLFSYGCRRLHVPVKQVELGFLVLVIVGAGAVLMRIVDYTAFLPAGAETQQLRLEALLAWAATLWSWTLLTDNRLLGVPVFAMAALGLAATLDLNNPVMICFGVFVVAVIFLLIHQNYLQNRARASAIEQAQPIAPMLLAQAAQTAVCALGVLIAGMLVIIPAQASFSRLSLGTAIRQLVNLGHVNGGTGGKQTLRYSDEDAFAIGTGDGWSSSPEPLFHVAPSDNQAHLWRGRTYDRYTGDGWQSSLENAIEPLPPTEQPLPGRAQLFSVPAALTPGDAEALTGTPRFGQRMVDTQVTLRVNSEQFYYAGSPRQIAFGHGGSESRRVEPEFCQDGRLDLSSHSPFGADYLVSSVLAPDPLTPSDQARLRAAGTDYPATIQQLYLGDLHTPITDDDDIAFFGEMRDDALSALPPDQKDPLDEALAIRNWVSQRCVYSLAVPPITPDADHVHEFLGHTRQGYCDMFASSMAVLCRSAGIPARVCTGFAPGEQDATGFMVRGEDKHAWVEVYFPHVGWAAFDPTADSRTDGTVPSAAAPTQPWSWLHWPHQTGFQRFVPVALVVAILLLIAYVLKTEVFDRRRALRRPRAVREAGELRRALHRTALGRHYARMSRSLAALGLPRRASETPGEYAARALPFLETQAKASGIVLDVALVGALTSEFIRACYAGEEYAGAEEGKWQAPLSEFASAARRIQWTLFWRRLPQSFVFPKKAVRS